MAYLNSSSTYAEVVAAYRDNASYDLQGSAEMCRLFIDACTHLLQRNSKEIEHGDERVVEDPGVIERLRSEARAWLAANDSTTSPAGTRGYVRYAGTRDIRR